MDYTKEIKKLLRQKDVECIESFVCRGYDTYGIFGKIGAFGISDTPEPVGSPAVPLHAG